MTELNDWLNQLLIQLANTFPEGTWLYQLHNLKALLAMLLVCLLCGAVGSMVVGNRLAFFSDALAHCAFAGIALGLLLAILTQPSANLAQESFYIPLVMVVFGIVVGLAIVWVKERTTLTADTVIGVFFAGAIGFGAVLLPALRNFSFLDPETFLFGSPYVVQPVELLALAVLLVVLVAAMFARYNAVVLASFNPSLAGSRGLSVRLYNYLFVILLALVVNLSIKAVGALLINALLVVPAATAANLSRNLRQMFWLSVGLSLFAGMAGLWLCANVTIPIGNRGSLDLRPGGTVVILSVLLFFTSLAFRGKVRPGPSPCC